MKYITQEQLDGIFSERSLKALAGSGGAIDPELLSKVNAEAVAEMNGYLRGIYNLPLAEPTDPQLSPICGDIMKYRLVARRGGETPIPPHTLEQYKMAVRKLELIQKRSIVLEVADADTGEIEPAKLDTIQMNTPTQKFGSHFTGFDGL